MTSLSVSPRTPILRRELIGLAWAMGLPPGGGACDGQLRSKAQVPQRKRRGDHSPEAGGAARDSRQARQLTPCAGEERAWNSGGWMTKERVGMNHGWDSGREETHVVGAQCQCRSSGHLSFRWPRSHTSHPSPPENFLSPSLPPPTSPWFPWKTLWHPVLVDQSGLAADPAWANHGNQPFTPNPS